MEKWDLCILFFETQKKVKGKCDWWIYGNCLSVILAVTAVMVGTPTIVTEERHQCRNNSKLFINFKTALGQKHISEKIWHWCRGSTLGFFHPQQHCKRRKQIFMRMLHQPLLGIILGLGHVYVVHTMYMSVLRQNCTDICFESWWWGSWHPHLRNLSTQAGRHTNPQHKWNCSNCETLYEVYTVHCTHYIIS